MATLGNVGKVIDSLDLKRLAVATQLSLLHNLLYTYLNNSAHMH